MCAKWPFFGAILLYNSDSVPNALLSALPLPLFDARRNSSWSDDLGGRLPRGEKTCEILLIVEQINMPGNPGQDLGPGDGGGTDVPSQQQQQVSPNESRVADQRACRNAKREPKHGVPCRRSVLSWFINDPLVDHGATHSALTHRTAAPFWGQTSLTISSLSPKRDCGPKRV